MQVSSFRTMTAFNDNPENKTEEELFAEIKHLKYRNQAIWFLDTTEVGRERKECEEVWRIHKKCVQLDKKQEQGSYLDEFTAHRVLESCSKAYTVQEMRNLLISINPNYNKSKKVSLAELLIFNYEVDWRKAIHQKCLDWEKKRKAEEKLDEATKALTEATNAAERAATDAKSAEDAEQHAIKEQEEASKAAEESRVAELAMSEAKEKSKETLEELKMQETKLQEKREALEKLSTDDNLGIVKRNKAKAELNMLLSKDPLPLRTAKLHQEASFKKLSKATKKAGEAASAAELCMKKAEVARVAARKSKNEAIETGKIAEAAIPNAQAACKAIQDELEKLMKDRKVGKGTIFYLEKELEVAKKFLPKSKFNIMQQAALNEKEKMRVPAIVA